MGVEHQLHQRPGQARPGIPEDGEPRPGEPGPPLEVEDPQRLSQVPMGLRLEVELRLRSEGADHHVVLFALPIGHALVGWIRHAEEEVLELSLHLGERLVAGLHRLGEPLQLGAEALEAIAAFLRRLRHLFAQRLLPVALLLGLSHQRLPLQGQFPNLGQEAKGVGSAAGEAGLDRLVVVEEVAGVEHAADVCAMPQGVKGDGPSHRPINLPRPPGSYCR